MVPSFQSCYPAIAILLLHRHTFVNTCRAFSHKTKQVRQARHEVKTIRFLLPGYTSHSSGEAKVIAAAMFFGVASDICLSPIQPWFEIAVVLQYGL